MVKRSRRVALAAGLVGLVGALTLVIAGAATADQGYTGPANQVLVSGNPTCPADTAAAGSTSIDGSQLNAGYNDGRIAITRRGVVNGIDSFDWALVANDIDVMAVIVKGGDNAYIYFYNTTLVASDQGLAPPLNNGGQAPAISHAVFCFDPKNAPPPELSVVKSASGTSQTTHSWAVDKQVKQAGAPDSAYGDNTVLNLPDGGNGSVTWKVTVTHSQVQTFTVDGTITVSNDGAVAVTGVDVTDSIPGAVIDCDGQGSTGITVPAHDSVDCDYTVTPGSEVLNNTATASWGSDNSASDDATIQWAATEVGTPASVVDDGDVDETIDTGDLTNGSWTTTYNEQWTCSKGTPSPNNGRTNTATVTWDGGSDSDSASVQVGCGNTPPPTPSTPTPAQPAGGNESMDVQIVKEATPQVRLVNGQADIAYSLVVKNNGPNQAHNVVVSDAAPGGVTFLSVTTQPVNGSCTVTSVLLNCSLGTLGPGVVRTIGLSARVSQTGTYVNCATVIGQGGDTNSANNRDCAETLVTAPLTPPVTPPAKPKPKPTPTATPKPKPAPNLCRVLTINTKMVKADGAMQALVAKVTRSRNPVKGVKVRFTGAGVSLAGLTNGKGVARVAFKTTKAGIIRVNITNAKACNTARIGVVGVFQPPVTG